MKIKLPTLTKTQKIITAFALATAIAFLVWGCETAPKSEVKTDSTEMKVDTLKVDTLK
jgi:starvation-inducible outer membrane lipoprotein